MLNRPLLSALLHLPVLDGDDGIEIMVERGGKMIEALDQHIVAFIDRHGAQGSRDRREQQAPILQQTPSIRCKSHKDETETTQRQSCE